MPEVVLVEKKWAAADDVLSICVERHVDGVPLSKLSRRRGRGDALLADALRHAGEVLARIHAVEALHLIVKFTIHGRGTSWDAVTEARRLRP